MEEEMAWRYIRMNIDTTDEKLAKDFSFWITEISPNVAPYSHQLNKKVYDSPYLKELDNDKYFVYLRGLKEEIKIYNKFVYDGLPLVPCIEKNTISEDVSDVLLSIYRELPKPLQFSRDDFINSLDDSDTILNTLRVGDKNGAIVGFAKGGPLEKYNFELDFEDKNRGKNNTIFLEPVAIKNGYWGFHGGREIRQLFMMQVQSQGYKFMTSFTMRDVIEERKKKEKNIVFVKKFDPERWDYFRVVL